MVDDQFRNLKSPRQQAGKLESCADFPHGELRIRRGASRTIERNMMQRKSERRPYVNSGRAFDRKPVPRVALDPVLHQRGDETGRDSDYEKHDNDRDQAGCTAPAIFNALAISK